MLMAVKYFLQEVFHSFAKLFLTHAITLFEHLIAD